MKNKVFILVMMCLIGFTATAQEAIPLKKKSDVVVEKQAQLTDVEGVSARQTKMLAKQLNLSDSQITDVSNLIARHLKSDKFNTLLGAQGDKQLTKAVQSEEVMDPVTTELFNDKSFVSGLNGILDDKQKEGFKQLVSKYLTPR